MTQCVIVQSPNYKEAANVFLQCGIKHFVSVKMSHDTIDNESMDFLEQFYAALVNGTTISRSFHLAIQSLKAQQIQQNSVGNNIHLSATSQHKLTNINSGMQDNEKFLLWPQSDDLCVHEVVMFPQMKPGASENNTDKFAPINLVNTIRSFLGRWSDMHCIMNRILEKSFTIVYGNESIGKSAVLTMVSKYIWERRRFIGGVIVIDCENSQSYRNYYNKGNNVQTLRQFYTSFF